MMERQVEEMADAGIVEANESSPCLLIKKSGVTTTATTSV